MTTAYDPKIVAVTALGLACFALGFSVTAAAYPAPARAAEASLQASSESPHGFTRSTPVNATRGCRIAD